MIVHAGREAIAFRWLLSVLRTVEWCMVIVPAKLGLKNNVHDAVRRRSAL
jgi:hypothetical protein